VVEAGAYGERWRGGREMTPEERRARARLRSLRWRRAPGLTQEEFAARYRIPLGTLRDWEQ